MSASRPKVTDRDRGYKALVKRLKDGAARLTVGIHEAEGDQVHDDKSGITTAELGAIHEFGLGHQERRSFLADYFDENKDENQERLKKIGRAIYKGTIPSVDAGLERLGNLFVGEIQKRISDGIPPELQEATIKRKGSSTPLVDTGVLKSSITYKVASDESGEGGSGGSE